MNLPRTLTLERSPLFSTMLNTKMTRWRLLLITLFIVAWNSSWSVAQATTFPPAVIPTNNDAYLVASQPTTNYGSGPLGVTPSAQALVGFDVSGLPAGASIISAKLRMMPADIIGTGPSTINISRVDGPWDEAMVTPATAPTATATGSSAVVSGYVVTEWDVLTTVQAWHSGSVANNGFMLTTTDPGVYFDSKESGRAPTLVIEFETPDRPDEPTNPGRRAHPELGDAPDSTNHHGLANTAYPGPGTAGNFPTVWNDPTGAPSGPMHFNEHGEGWLGYHASAEREADMGGDQDGVNNIILTAGGPADVANRDRGDDGWLNRNATFVDCQRTTLDVRVSRAMTPTLDTMYLNVWFDGNRDGDWNDVAKCRNSQDGPEYPAYEWIVHNFAVNMAAIPPGGFQDIAVNTLAVLNKTADGAHWMRFTLSERPAITPPSANNERLPADGRGPQHPNGFKYGETEDYFQRPAPQGEPGTLELRKGVQLGTSVDVVRPGDVVSFTIQLAHVGGSAPAATVISDSLPSGVHLAGRPQINIDGRISPVTVHVDPTSLGWAGLIDAGTKVQITFPVKVERCFGGVQKEIRNVVHARQTDGSRISADAAFKVQCPEISLDNIEIRRFLALRDRAIDDVVVDEGTVDAAATTGTGNEREIAGFVPGTHTVVRTVVKNNNPMAVVLGFNFEEIKWEFVASDPDNGDSRSSTEVATTSDGSGILRLKLEAGETKVIDTPIPAPDRVIEAIDQDVQGMSAVKVCLLGEDDRICPDPNFLRRLIVRFLVRRSDLGDGPDSTNHFGVGMEAYPGVPANFPVTNDPTLPGNRGPLHWNAWPLHLGRGVSFELGVDIGPDQDGINNIVPPANVANRDRYDDGIRPDLISFNHCQETRIPVQVFVTPAMKAYMLANNLNGHINIWVDSNRNGQGGDVFPCPATDTTAAGPALEHIVINHVVNPAVLVPGVNTIIVPTGRVAWPADMADKPAWMRVKLTAAPDELPLIEGDIRFSDFRGKVYRFGETEDYLLRPKQEPNGADMAVRKHGRVQQEFNPENGSVVSKVAWAIEYHNIGDVPAREVNLRDMLDRGVDLNAVLLDVRTSPEIPYTIDGQSLVFRAGEVAPGEGGKIAIIMATRQLTISGNVITNTVVVNAANDANADNNEAQARVHIGLRPPRIVSPIDGSTCRNEVEIMGVAQRRAEVDVYIDDSIVGTVNTDENGRWRHAVRLDDGRHTIYAIARVAGVSSSPSNTVDLLVDSSLIWNPISLTFTDERGRVRRPHDADGRLDATGWSLNLRPNTTYTVEVEICCEDGNADVTLAVDGIDEVLTLTDDDGDGIYSATFHTGPRNDVPAAMTLTVVCGDSTVTSSGDVVLIDPEGVVFNVLDGNLITDANVACMEANVSAAEDGSTSTIFALWDAETYGQINPQMTLADGYFSFMTPVGTYRVVVNKAGYQLHTSPDLAVVNDPVRYDVPLTPVISEAAGAQVSIGEFGFEPAVLTVEPGTIIEWTNVDVDGHTASSESAANAAGLNANGILFDSGLLGSGESYKFQLTDEGTYTVFDRTNPANSATVVVEKAEVTQPGENAIFLPIVQR